MGADAAYSSLKEGWRVMSSGSHDFVNLADSKAFRPPLRNRTWLRVHDPRNKQVCLPAALGPSVYLWLHASASHPWAW